MLNVPIPPDIEAVFESYPQEMKPKLLYLRQLIYDVATACEDVGEIEEALKWGEPSYLTPKSKSGSTIRLAWKEAKPDKYSIFFKCTANLVLAFKEQFPDTFTYGGKRSLDFSLDDEVPINELRQCIAMALTYHHNKKLDPQERWEFVKETV